MTSQATHQLDPFEHPFRRRNGLDALSVSLEDVNGACDNQQGRRHGRHDGLLEEQGEVEALAADFDLGAERIVGIMAAV